MVMEWEHNERPRKRLCMTGVKEPKISTDEGTQSVRPSCLKTSLEFSTASIQYECCESRKHLAQHEAGRYHGDNDTYGRYKETNADIAKKCVNSTIPSNKTVLSPAFAETYHAELDAIEAETSEESGHYQPLTSHAVITQDTAVCHYTTNQWNRLSALPEPASCVPPGRAVDQDASIVHQGVFASTGQVCFGMVGVVYSRLS